MVARLHTSLDAPADEFRLFPLPIPTQFRRIVLDDEMRHVIGARVYDFSHLDGKTAVYLLSQTIEHAPRAVQFTRLTR